MNTTIWKFQILIASEQRVTMPAGAEILTAQFQSGNGLCLWAIVNPENPKNERVIHIYGTGHPVPNANGIRYITTVQQHGGALVWHIFESKP